MEPEPNTVNAKEMINKRRATTARLIKRSKPNAALPRMAVAFITGMVLTAILAYIPVITDIFNNISNQEHAAPAPSYALPNDGSYPDQQNTRAPVYAPQIEGTFTV